MKLEKGGIVITKGRIYVGRANNYLYIVFPLVMRVVQVGQSGGSNVENVSYVGMNDVTDGMIANVNEVNFSGYFVCSISL